MSARKQRVSELAAEGLPQRDMARRLGVTRQRVSQIVRKHGIETDRARPGNPDATKRAKRIERMKSECAGMTVAEAARHLGVTVTTVRSDRKESGFAGLVHSNWRTPLSDQTKRIIEASHALAARGLSKSEAARELGISPAAFITAVLRYLPDIEWRDGRDGKGACRRHTPLAAQCRANHAEPDRRGA